MTADADAYQRLTRALDAHRGDAEAYRRLGAQMTTRRHLLGPRYGNRKLFVRELLLPLGLKETAAYKLVYDLERGELQGRAGFSAGNMLALAQAYRTTPDEVIAVLDGGELNAPPVTADAAAATDALAVTVTERRADSFPRRELPVSGTTADADLEFWRQQVLRQVYTATGLISRFGPGELPEPSEIDGAEEILPEIDGAVIFSFDHEVLAWDNPRIPFRDKIDLIARLRMLWAKADAENQRRADAS